MKYLLAYEEKDANDRSYLFILGLVDSEKEAIDFCTKQNKLSKDELEESKKNDQTFVGWKHLVIRRSKKVFKYAEVSEFVEISDDCKVR